MTVYGCDKIVQTLAHNFGILRDKKNQPSRMVSSIIMQPKNIENKTDQGLREVEQVVYGCDITVTENFIYTVYGSVPREI